MINPFSKIVKEQLSSVIFIQDYLQIDFDGNLITFYTWPTVVNRNKKFSFNEMGYRDALCSLISQIVKDVYFEDDVLFKITFETGNSIELSLREVDKEVIYYVASDGEWSSI